MQGSKDVMVALAFDQAHQSRQESAKLNRGNRRAHFTSSYGKGWRLSICRIQIRINGLPVLKT